MGGWRSWGGGAKTARWGRGLRGADLIEGEGVREDTGIGAWGCCRGSWVAE